MNDILVLLIPILSTFQYNDIAYRLADPVCCNIITTLYGVQDPSDENDDEIDDDFDNSDKHLHRRNGNNNVLEELTQGLPNYTRKEIVTRWLEGEQRDKIAAGMELGAGTISAIVSEWKAEIGIPTVDSLRHFSTELRRLGVTASQCVLGCRILSSH